MKVVFFAGSRKFSDEINLAINRLTKEGIKIFVGRDADDKNDADFSDKMRERICKADIVYVIAKDGYTGDSVELEILYAHERGKEIISSEIVKDANIRKLISKTMNADELIAYLKDSP